MDPCCKLVGISYKTCKQTTEAHAWISFSLIHIDDTEDIKMSFLLSCLFSLYVHVNTKHTQPRVNRAWTMDYS